MIKTDWKEIYSTEFFDSPQCWKTCGGYCCKNFYGEHLKILDKTGVSLPLTASEYRYYESIGGITNITTPVKERVFHLANGKSFKIYLLSCKCGGLCDPHGHRPLICRIYPYFPVVDSKGNIEGFEYAALMDLFYRKPDENHKCTLVREQSVRIKNELSASLQPLLKDPEIVFLFRTLKLLVDRLKKKMDGFIDELSDEDKKRFIAKYEWMILTGKPWQDASFSAEVTQVYDEVKDCFGGVDFL